MFLEGYFYFYSIGVWTQGFALARQALYHLSHSYRLFLMFSYPIFVPLSMLYTHCLSQACSVSCQTHRCFTELALSLPPLPAPCAGSHSVSFLLSSGTISHHHYSISVSFTWIK
jgi:hypothetical protein